MATRNAGTAEGGETTLKQAGRKTGGKAAQADGADGSAGSQPSAPRSPAKASNRGAGAKASTSDAGAKASKASGRSATTRAKGPDLRADVRDFAAGRPQGWNHEEWIGFLEQLQGRGHNINDREAIGLMLEKERISLRLEKVQGMGPQRVRALADRYGTIWRLREADVEELTRDANLPRSLAERVVEAVRQ